jgi:hypothetical protein
MESLMRGQRMGQLSQHRMLKESVLPVLLANPYNLLSSHVKTRNNP